MGIPGTDSGFNIRQVLTGCCLLLASTLATAEQVVYSFGVVPQYESRVLFSIWQPVLQELERRTGLKFRLVGSPKIPVFEQSFIAGEFDFAYTNPFHLYLAEGYQDYIPLIRDGSRMLQGIVVVKKDSPYKKLADLQNKTIAFPSVNALGASLAVRATFSDAGLTAYKPLYVQTHSSVYLHVATGLTDAGGGVLSTLQAQPTALQQDMRIIQTATGIPTHPVAAHPRVPVEHRERVQKAFLAMAKTAQGKKLLDRIPMYKPVRTDMRTYKVISAMGFEKYYIKPARKQGDR
ncbi:MAG TPA: phosphate/phosphite/phosphonate ABC transporter substrate-binding protein [Gammaproteobacteria bacterium]|nr:phosphate/phosphite/phosphonate ABC transporter substrate-binding protein [Gammaproteobacteria bacterium]